MESFILKKLITNHGKEVEHDMENRFNINKKEEYMENIKTFVTVRSSMDKLQGREIIYDINPEYGKGFIKIYKLMGNMMLIIYDTVFNEDFITEYNLSKDYFEVAYCVDGSAYVKEEKVGTLCFSKNNISISMSRETKGLTKQLAGQRYQSVSITTEKSALNSYFGSYGIELWEDTMEELEERVRKQYFKGISASPELANTFLQIYNCKLPQKSKILFFESKIMEILCKIVSEEISEPSIFDQLQLDEFEISQIKRVPKILMENLYDLPTINKLSRELAINKNKLAKGFKFVYGDTIFRYHRKMCLQKSIALLFNANKAINEIALDVGYSTPSNFCCAFKKEFGVTPLQYRERCYNNENYVN